MDTQSVCWTRIKALQLTIYLSLSVIHNQAIIRKVRWSDGMNMFQRVCLKMRSTNSYGTSVCEQTMKLGLGDRIW